MDGWEKLSETSSPEKKIFIVTYIGKIFAMQITHTQKFVCSKRYIVVSQILLANICLEIYELDTAHFLAASDLAWQAALKKTKLKLDLLTDISMLVMAEKGIRGGICHSIHEYL